MALFRYLALFLLFYFFYKMVMGLFRSKESNSPFVKPDSFDDDKKKHQKLIPEDEGEYVDYEDIEKD